VARIYANENFPRPVVIELRQLGHDVLTTEEAGQAGRWIVDSEVLKFAAREGRAVLTLNRRDFVRLHTSAPGHAGIIVCTEDLDFAGQARRIDEALRTLPSLAGQLVRVSRPPSPT